MNVVTSLTVRHRSPTEPFTSTQPMHRAVECFASPARSRSHPRLNFQVSDTGSKCAPPTSSTVAMFAVKFSSVSPCMERPTVRGDLSTRRPPRCALKARGTRTPRTKLVSTSFTCVSSTYGRKCDAVPGSRDTVQLSLFDSEWHSSMAPDTSIASCLVDHRPLSVSRVRNHGNGQC